MTGRTVRADMSEIQAVGISAYADTPGQDKEGTVEPSPATSPTCSAVKPKYFITAPPGADSPKRSMPTTAPSRPTYLYQEIELPASTATRRTPDGSPESRQAASWRSNTV